MLRKKWDEYFKLRFTTSSKLIVDELGRDSYFANNEQVYLAVFFWICWTLIRLNWSTQVVNNFEVFYVKFKQTNQICSSLKINQSTSNKAHMIKIKKTHTTAFMKSKNSLVVRCREKKKQKAVKIDFFKPLLIDFI